MKFQFKLDLITNISADIITLAIDDKNQIFNAKYLDKKLLAQLNNILEIGDLSEKIGEIMMVHSGDQFSRVILLRVGSRSELNAKEFFKCIVNLTKNLKLINFKTIRRS